MAPIDSTPAPLRLERSGGTLERRKGVYIAQLRGSYSEMGRQHGELAAAACGDIVPQYVNQLVRKLVAHTLPSVAAPAAALLKAWFQLRNREELGADMREQLAALAAAHGFPSAMAERLFMVPDIFHYLAGRSFAALAPPPSCSAFFAHGGATRDGKLLIARNFDFFGRGVWNANNAFIVMHPRGGRSFCWVGALGVPASGQGFNESGLFVGLHSNFPNDVSTRGVPIFKIVHDILAECATLDEAVARVTVRPRTCGLSLFIVDTRARDAAVVGYSARHAETLRPENEVLVRANHYVTPPMQRFEVGPHPWRANSVGRMRRITELLGERRGALDAGGAPSILSDIVDPFEGRRVLVGNVVAAPHNVQSLVMSPDEDTVWLAHGDLPLCHSERYRGFSVSALLEGDESRYETGDLSGGGQLSETERAALLEYEEAWSSYMDHLDYDRAVFHLRRGAELTPEESVFPRMAGILLLKEKRFSQALPLLLRNAEHEHRDPVNRAEAHVWAGRCLDLMGRRAEALAQYDTASKLDAPPVSAAAARHLEKPFRRMDLFHVMPEFMLGTGLAKY
ncbi:MAG: hypothetical protein GX580_15930 [Candidatus Hydrogenedens sp.]|nr:hypothetical protein [Candidatus Hydrogenedentota bacterium]NLF59118.1 hypothetical protein [Candidatus Hydrogenedens sp.]